MRVGQACPTEEALLVLQECPVLPGRRHER
jgi:hypothetical protein